MIQDILPKIYKVEYQKKQPEPDSQIFLWKENQVLLKSVEEQISYPTYDECKVLKAEYTYLFAIGEVDYFLADTKEKGYPPEYSFVNVSDLRTVIPKYQAFAGITAYQLYIWYRDNRFCGRCGAAMKHDHQERMLLCNQCNNMVYPRIFPAVIVAVTDGDRLLLTRYAGRAYNNYALIAGFSEIGETVEQTVVREVKEEVGLRVKNISYYGSQPWSLTGTLLFGFFAEVDGDTSITLDEKELSEAKWFSRADIEIEDDGISLTREMIRQFKQSGYVAASNDES